MAKIAVELQQALQQRAIHGCPGRTAARMIATGDGWSVDDVICTCGPQDRPFEEQHSSIVIALVAAGSFQYRASSHYSSSTAELMTPGSLVLGNIGQHFECGHEHAIGDRCVAFRYSLEYFETVIADSGARIFTRNFSTLRLPPLRTLSPITAQVLAGLVTSEDTAWEELALQLAVQALQLAHGQSVRGDSNSAPPSTLARITRAVRAIDRDPHASLSLGALARESRLSPYHFLRTFERLTGLTPHQYILRTRLRESAVRLASGSAKVLDVAFDSGFKDVSNFNRAFRTEFGQSPRAYRNSLAI